MPTAGTPAAAPAAIDDSSRQRWAQLLDGLVGLLPAGSRRVLIDGPADRVSLLADRLTERLAACGRPVLVAAGTGTPGDVSIFLRTAPGGRRPAAAASGSPEAEGGERDDGDRREREARADIVIDLYDLSWPVIRRVAVPLAAGGSWYLTETRAFFACRAATWDAKFGDDIPAYRAAVDEAGISRGGVVADVGCGTGTRSRRTSRSRRARYAGQPRRRAGCSPPTTTRRTASSRSPNAADRRYGYRE